MLKILGIIVLILLVVFTLLVLNSRSVESCLIQGFWKGAPSFMQEAELDLFLIYFGENSTLSSKRQGYILMKNDNGLIINNPVEFSFSSGGSITPGICSCREYIVTIDWLGEEAPDFFPEEQELYYYPEHGKLVFSVDDTVFGVLYKDNIISDIDNNMPDSVEQTEYEGGEDI